MIRLLPFIALGLLVSLHAQAQLQTQTHTIKGNVCVNTGGQLYWTGDGTCGSQHERTGDDDLDRAVGLCDSHRTSVGNTMITTYPGQTEPEYVYDSGWNDKPLYACSKVYSAWYKSDAVRKDREAKEQDKRDLDFVQGYSRGLK